MTTIESIQTSISAELKELNLIIRQALSSDSLLLQQIVEEYLKRKGKQIRPILVILSAKIAGEVRSEVIHAAASIELLHNASLIHDDVLDESQIRRGVSTINRIWDNQVAVLVGDFFVSRALSCAVNTGSIDVIRSMSELGSTLSRGEIDQIDHARSHDINEKHYFEIIEQKTASLFRSCIEVGCFASGGKGDELELLRRYAVIMGLCFQIKDDIFDYFDDDVIGKPTGNDLREGKVTLPLIYALSKGDSDERREMSQLLSSETLTTEDINRLIDFAKREGGIEYAYAKMEELKAEAYAILAKLPQSDAVESLKAVFEYIIQRKK